MTDIESLNPEADRLKRRRWRRWGPYLAERQWGTVREDYSTSGSYWDYFSFDHARSRAYRWGEDGIAGISDDQQLLCLSVALWNHRDPFLKERLFGLTNSEGNHGEDVKECYYYLDALPSHAYLKMLYKYPQRSFPYDELRRQNGDRSKKLQEFELLDTGCFDEDRYFDVVIEYAKAAPDDILMQITVHNRGPEPAPLDVLPQLLFRNTWSWKENVSKPVLYQLEEGVVEARHLELEPFFLYADGPPPFIFCENVTHPSRIHGFDKALGYFKDGFHDFIVNGAANAVNPLRTGTKAAAHYSLMVQPGAPQSLMLRLTNRRIQFPFEDFGMLVSKRRDETDAFYGELQAGIRDEDARRVQRQAFAGMIWSKQFYYYDVWEWLKGDPLQPPPPKERRLGRNMGWRHLNNADIISMPDKWEFPWYATWDLAFHCVTFALIDPQFSKDQLTLFTLERFMHPNGHLPAYEGGLSDVNPPVHAWAALKVYEMNRAQNHGEGDLRFLESIFHKLLLNFTWWVNKKALRGSHVFQAGFLGLDNIGIVDRGDSVPEKPPLVQADATGWMAMYSLNMMRIAVELAAHNPSYQDVASKFFQHFLYISEAMHDFGDSRTSLWDDNDNFYYDVLDPVNAAPQPLKVRSVVGLVPLFAAETFDHDLLQRLPQYQRQMDEFVGHRPDLAKEYCHYVDRGQDKRHLFALLSGTRLKSVLKRVFDEAEFLSPFGIRGLSRGYLHNPYCLDNEQTSMCIEYQPGESTLEYFGGNSNWRGPIWMPINYLLIESLRRYHQFYGQDFRVEFPTGSGRFETLNDIAAELSLRLCKTFLRNDRGQRPAFGDNPKLQDDPNFRDHLLFHEYFHGDTGRGCGASHQTGWTGLVANLIQESAADGDRCA